MKNHKTTENFSYSNTNTLNLPEDIYAAAMQMQAGSYTLNDLTTTYLDNITVIQGQTAGLKDADLQVWCNKQHPINVNRLNAEIQTTGISAGIQFDPTSLYQVSHTDDATTIQGNQGTLVLKQDAGYIDIRGDTRMYLYS